MSAQLDLFEQAKTMVRRTDDLPAGKLAAVRSITHSEENRRLILRLLVENHPNPLTQFCPYVLMGCDVQYKQTAIGPRFRKLRDSGLIRHIGERQPRPGAESSNWVSAFVITEKGRDYLAGCGLTGDKP